MQRFKLILILSIPLAIFILAFISYFVYLSFKTDNIETIQINPDVNINDYFSPTPYNSQVALPLKKFPSNYEDMTKDLGISLSHSDKIKLFKYGTVVIQSDGLKDLSIKEAFSKLDSTSTPIVLSNQILDLYFQQQLATTINEKLIPQLSSSLKEALKINMLDLVLKDPSYFVVNMNDILSTISKLKSISKNDEYKEIIMSLNGLSEKEIEVLQKYWEKNGYDKAMIEINRVNGILNYPRIFSKKEITANPSLDYTSIETKNLFEFQLYENTNDLLKKIVEVGSEDIEIKTSSIYMQKDNILLPFYLSVANYYSDVYQPNQEIEKIFEGMKIEVEELNGKYSQDTLKSLISDLTDVSIPEGYILAYQLVVVNDGKTNLVGVSPIIFNTLNDITISNSNFSGGYAVSTVKQSSGSVRIPVLMYHHIDKIPSGAKASVVSMYVTPAMFEEQMAFLLANNYKTLSISEFYNILASGKNPPQKSVLLTFDDSKTNHYTNAFPILKKYGFKGTFFVVSARSGISVAQLKEMSDAGMNIESHSVTHPNLKKLGTSGEVYYQVVGSKGQLEYITGRSVTAIAFPGCEWDSRTLSAMGSGGYKLGFSCGRAIDHYYSHRYVLSRYHVDNEMGTFKRYLSGRF